VRPAGPGHRRVRERDRHREQPPGRLVVADRRRADHPGRVAAMATPPWDERYLEYRPNHRVSLLIRAAIFVPSGLLITVLLVIAARDLPGTILIVIFLGLGALALDTEGYQTTRDLFSQPMTSRGRVRRQWKK